MHFKIRILSCCWLILMDKKKYNKLCKWCRLGAGEGRSFCVGTLITKTPTTERWYSGSGNNLPTPAYCWSSTLRTWRSTTIRTKSKPYLQSPSTPLCTPSRGSSYKELTGTRRESRRMWSGRALSGRKTFKNYDKAALMAMWLSIISICVVMMVVAHWDGLWC